MYRNKIHTWVYRGVINGKAGKAATLPKFSDMLTYLDQGVQIKPTHWLCLTFCLTVCLIVVTPLVYIIHELNWLTILVTSFVVERLKGSDPMRIWSFYIISSPAPKILGSPMYHYGQYFQFLYKNYDFVLFEFSRICNKVSRVFYHFAQIRKQKIFFGWDK